MFEPNFKNILEIYPKFLHVTGNSPSYTPHKPCPLPFPAPGLYSMARLYHKTPSITVCLRPYGTFANRFKEQFYSRLFISLGILRTFLTRK